MSAMMDLTQNKAMSALSVSDLASQVGAIAGVGESQVTVFGTVIEAIAALEQQPNDAVSDLSAFGVVGLERLSTTGPSLVQLGPDDKPICVVIWADQTRATSPASPSPIAPVLLRAGFDALKPIARHNARLSLEAVEGGLADIALALDTLGTFETVTTEPFAVRLTGASRDSLRALGLKLQQDGESWRAHIPDLDTAQALLVHLGARPMGRKASVRRTTKETDISLVVDLDGQGASVRTGVHFFDHMLEQIARHGGIGLDVVCDGDVEVDTHHTIEDVCLALGDALRQALGDKRGISRFGFETPMDETRSSVWIDLSGRPYSVFEGDIPGERVGDFPVEMCEHCFRSISETLKAAIHVKVQGDNAHHMIESCFKSFGRALRMASRVEGEALPSTKGVL